MEICRSSWSKLVSCLRESPKAPPIHSIEAWLHLEREHKHKVQLVDSIVVVSRSLGSSAAAYATESSCFVRQLPEATISNQVFARSARRVRLIELERNSLFLVGMPIGHPD